MLKSLGFLHLAIRALRGQRRVAGFYLLASLGDSLAAALVMWLVKRYLDTVSTSGGSVTLWGAAGAACGLILGAWMFRALCACFRRIWSQKLQNAVLVSQMMLLTRHLLRQSVAFFDRQSRSEILSAVRLDVHTVYVAVECLCTLFSNLVTVVALAATAFWLSPRLFGWVIIILPVLTLPILLSGNRMLRASENQRTAGFQMMDHLMDLFAGLRLVKLFRSETQEVNRFREIAERYFEAQLRFTRHQALAHVSLEAIAGIGLVAVILLGGMEVQSGKLTWPGLLTFLITLMGIFEPARWVTSAYSTIQQNIPGSERLGELLALRPEIEDGPNARALLGQPEIIRLENVGFAYSADAPVIKDVCLEIRAGEVIGVVGPSGAGKSTLLSLLSRFYDPTEGAVYFDGVNLRDYKLATVYDHVSAVLQIPFVFNTTLRENIRYGRPDATDAEVEQAARDANLYDEIQQMPQGYDTVLGAGGQDLSVGQRQRLNIARALLKNAPILLLDEATSALDSISEARVQAALDRLMEGRTVIAVAHRLSTLRGAHRLVVMKQGRVEAIGTHAELLKSSDTYRLLCEHQAMSTEDAKPVPEAAAQPAALA